MVMESTYGNRQHADRAQQEAALAHRVSEVIDAGGKVLVPAFRRRPGSGSDSDTVPRHAKGQDSRLSGIRRWYGTFG